MTLNSYLGKIWNTSCCSKIQLVNFLVLHAVWCQKLFQGIEICTYSEVKSLVGIRYKYCFNVQFLYTMTKRRPFTGKYGKKIHPTYILSLMIFFACYYFLRTNQVLILFRIEQTNYIEIACLHSWIIVSVTNWDIIMDTVTKLG